QLDPVYLVERQQIEVDFLRRRLVHAHAVHEHAHALGNTGDRCRLKATQADTHLVGVALLVADGRAGKPFERLRRGRRGGGARKVSREGGMNPPRPRHANRGRNPRLATGRTQRGAAGKVRGVGRSESQETCPGAHLGTWGPATGGPQTPYRSSREDPGMSSL